MGTITRIVVGIIVFGVLVGGAVALTPPESRAKLQAWSGVVAKDVESRIDALLGEEEVLRQQALDAMAAAQADIGRLQELAITSRVDAELLAEKIVELQALEARSKAQLGKLAQLVNAGEPVTVNGTTWQPAELAAYAETQIQAHAAIQERVKVYEESRRIQVETAARAEAGLRVAQQNVANMQASLELLDAKLALLQALDAEPAAFNGRSVTVDTVLDDTENLIATLMEDVEREIRLAEERSNVHGRSLVDVNSPLPELEANALAEQLFALAEEK